MTAEQYEGMKNGLKPDILNKYPVADLFVPAMDKLVTLCHKCHLNLHSVRKTIADAYLLQPLLKARRRFVFDARAKRMTTRQIGALLGISHQRVSQLLRESEAA